VSQRGKLTTIMLPTAAVMVATLMAILFMGIATSKANRELLRNRIVIDQLQETISSLKDAETGQRGYLLTGDEKYLTPYSAALARLHSDLAHLAATAESGDLPGQDVTTVARLTAQKLGELQQTVALRRTQGLPAALAIVQTNLGKQVMDAIRAQIVQMTAIKESALAEAHKRVDLFVISSRTIIGLSTLLNLAVLAWAYWRINEESIARETASIALRDQKE
jgi:CHASE3 domain sensor protein